MDALTYLHQSGGAVGADTSAPPASTEPAAPTPAGMSKALFGGVFIAAALVAYMASESYWESRGAKAG